MYLLKFILRNDFVEGKRITIEGIVLIRQQVSRDRLSVHDLKDHEALSIKEDLNGQVEYLFTGLI